ncbi:hypothetical protein HMPREF1318_0404 [Actinomyces massiliensis F0489]|uniref:Uncharacterized protein n=1 Tax=Actinomyces massiliensis F0489 TaxID=1125718 RepID=J1GV86_9ACTO|nr:hypothetical protein HMPREF1318_0404 [Actinomyces massiliensis F0489]
MHGARPVCSYGGGGRVMLSRIPRCAPSPHRLCVAPRARPRFGPSLVP